MLLLVGSRYSFDVYPSSVIGNDFKNVKVQALMDAATAAKFTDILALHEAVRPFLPVGTLTDPLKYTYVRVQNNAGAYVVIANEWINQDTIAESFSSRVVITVNNASAADPVRLRDLLIRANYPDIEIKII